MAKKEILEQMKSAILDLDEDGLKKLIEEGLEAKLTPLQMITEGMSPGLAVIGEGFDVGKRFMSDLVIAGEMMTEATERLRPIIEAGGKPLGDTMVIGTVEGDVHFVGKRIVSAVFTGAGFRVIDIGENMSASAFVSAAKEHRASVVGASAILSPVKAYCDVINKALVTAGLRDKVIFIAGGWGFTPEWGDKVGVDYAGTSAVEALNRVMMMKAGELPKLKDRQRK